MGVHEIEEGRDDILINGQIIVGREWSPVLSGQRDDHLAVWLHTELVPPGLAQLVDVLVNPSCEWIISRVV